MNVRRIALAAGAATGGVLAAGFLSTAVAFAAPVTGDPDFTAPGSDSFTIGSYTFDPYLSTIPTGDTTAPEGFNPLLFGTGSPTYFDTGAGSQNFDVFETTTGSTTPTDVGSIAATENVTQLFGITNTGFTVDTANLDTAATGSLPTVGTTYDVTNYGDGYINYYTDVPGSTASTGTVTDTLVTPFGDYDLSKYFTAFDLGSLEPGAAFGLGTEAAAGAATAVDPLAFLGL